MYGDIYIGLTPNPAAAHRPAARVSPDPGHVHRGSTGRQVLAGIRCGGT